MGDRRRRRVRSQPQPGFSPDMGFAGFSDRYEQPKRQPHMPPAMPQVGLSTLRGVSVVLIGYGFVAHPEKAGWWVNMTFYFSRAGIIICISEGNEPQEPMILDGAPIPGELIMPYAQRLIGGTIDQAAFAEFRLTLAEGYPETRFEWIEELPVVPV